MDYKNTLNLPKTDFPMKAGLAEQEPKRLEKWETNDLYHKILSRRDPNKKYVLHDGPPYANGNIHIGTAMNKILKDFIVKSKSSLGYYSPYIPGWDCHGLPIEHKVDKELGDKKVNMTKNQIRKICRKYAAKWLDIQRTSFKRLGVIGDWVHPYITMDYDYEAITLKEFYRVFKKGGVYKGSKPVYWCTDCVTALAEAEVEYKDHLSDSIFVKFPLTDETRAKLGIDKPASAVIWTTTPWTLPANMALSVNANEIYSLMEIEELTEKSIGNLKKGELILVAQPLVLSEESTLKKDLAVASWKEVKSFKGKDLERLVAKHPFYDRDSLMILSEHVLMTGGTGIVHTAPAHGVEDYQASLKYDIAIYNPVDDYGRYKDDVELYKGMKVRDANKEIVALMRDNGSLIAFSKISHSYPHCWRCKEPIIYRTTPQWFISMEHDNLREKALKAIREEVRWIPTWGSNRIGSMVETRPDWCISRQRTWGVPIALFTCRKCESIIFNEDIEKKVLDSFKDMGADAWFEYDVEYYLGKNAKCPHCGSTDIKQEMDILDVWFDSGTSHAAVCEVRPEINGKADMYLEGSDQHRGWFQSSLLESVATRGEAPYREVLTHGFIVDKDKQKMSKSLGNITAPEELVSKYGAEIIRLWVASEDYSNDISISQDIINRQVESYRKIRNTARYLLGSLYDFNPETDSVDYKEMMELDRYILARWQELCGKIYDGYDNYQFHVFYHLFLNFCINDLSALYLDVIKDRIYSYAPASKMRRSAQTVMFTLIRDMAVVMAPVLSFTADEIWDYLPAWEGKSTFVFEEVFPQHSHYKDDSLSTKMETLIEIRKNINKALELSRAAKVIGHPLDAKVTLVTDSEMPTIDEGMSRFLIVSEFVKVDKSDAEGYISEDSKMKVIVEPSKAMKCSRCWTKDDSVGKNAAYSELCSRCASVMEEIK